MQEVDKNVFFYPLMRLFLSSFQANQSGKMGVQKKVAHARMGSKRNEMEIHYEKRS